MKNNTKSSITLPPNELSLVLKLQKHLKAKTKVEVIRQGLLRLKESLDKEELKSQFTKASEIVGKQTIQELEELEHLTSEGLKNK